MKRRNQRLEKTHASEFRIGEATGGYNRSDKYLEVCPTIIELRIDIDDEAEP